MHCETLLALEIAENFASQRQQVCVKLLRTGRHAEPKRYQRGWRQAAEADRLLLLTLGQHCKMHT